MKQPNARVSLWIALGNTHHHADAPHNPHCWLTSNIKAPTLINTAIRIPTTNETTQCRRSVDFDPAPFCAAPIPNQKRRLLTRITREPEEFQVSFALTAFCRRAHKRRRRKQQTPVNRRRSPYSSGAWGSSLFDHLVSGHKQRRLEFSLTQKPLEANCQVRSRSGRSCHIQAAPSKSHCYTDRDQRQLSNPARS